MMLIKRICQECLVWIQYARYYAAKPGDVFRVIRPSPFAGMAFHYRQVIDSNVKVLYDK